MYLELWAKVGPSPPAAEERRKVHSYLRPVRVRPVVDTAPYEQRNENEYFRGCVGGESIKAGLDRPRFAMILRMDYQINGMNTRNLSLQSSYL